MWDDIIWDDIIWDGIIWDGIIWDGISDPQPWAQLCTSLDRPGRRCTRTDLQELHKLTEKQNQRWILIDHTGKWRVSSFLWFVRFYIFIFFGDGGR